jgi:tetraacyldisaccharide 4'-kinase
MSLLDRHWQNRTLLAWGLWPLSLLFCAVVRVRALAYRRGLLASRGLPVPVIVIGNLSVGGTGKTPLVIWLARRLRAQGRRPGILTRGYRGQARTWPQWVAADSDPSQVGDEPVLLARHSGCPVAAGPDRLASGQLLLERGGCDLLLCDDGLQHYALRRDLEVAVLDGERRLGNGFCLPAGPLREPPSRLDGVPLQLVNGPARASELALRLHGARALRLQDPSCSRALEEFRDRKSTRLNSSHNPASRMPSSA